LVDEFKILKIWLRNELVDRLDLGVERLADDELREGIERSVERSDRLREFFPLDYIILFVLLFSFSLLVFLVVLFLVLIFFTVFFFLLLLFLFFIFAFFFLFFFAAFVLTLNKEQF
jgi:hypothetical protein